MDNKITKKRLNNFFAYEWIAMIITIFVAILCWEFVYSITSVRLSVGRQFAIFYDENITQGSSSLTTLVKDDLSYDVVISSEQMLSTYNVLTTRTSMQEGDIVITDTTLGTDKSVRAKTIIDGNAIYTLDNLYTDANDYLSNFYDGGSLLTDKVKDNFLSRMKGDNRYRTEEEKEQGIKEEIERIEKLKKDVEEFKNFLDTAEDSCFFRYTKGEQSLTSEDSDSITKETYQKVYDYEVQNGRENARYGIDFSKLTGGEHNISEYFTLTGTANAENTVVMVFNFKSYQEDLQYETVSFLVSVIKACSNII